MPPRRPAAPPAALARPRRRWRAAVVAVVVALVGYLAVEAYAPYHAWSSATRVSTDPGGERPTSSGSTYLLVGSDSREGLTRAERSSLGTGSNEGRRTDSIILVHVPSGGGRSALISIPRDSFLPIPGNGTNKVNAAFAIGGPALLVQTLEQATGLRIDGYVEIGFGGFARVVDSLGGVRICVPFPMNDRDAHINLKKGCQVLDGKNALGFVRARKSDPRGDIGRAERQRQFLAAVVAQAATVGTVANPVRWWSFTHASVSGLTVGEDTSLLDALRVVRTMQGAGSGDSLSLVVPLSSTNTSTSAGSSVIWDDAAAARLFTLLREGSPLEAPPAGTDGKPSGG